MTPVPMKQILPARRSRQLPLLAASLIASALGMALAAAPTASHALDFDHPPCPGPSKPFEVSVDLRYHPWLNVTPETIEGRLYSQAFQTCGEGCFTHRESPIAEETLFPGDAGCPQRENAPIDACLHAQATYTCLDSL